MFLRHVEVILEVFSTSNIGVFSLAIIKKLKWRTKKCRLLHIILYKITSRWSSVLTQKPIFMKKIKSIIYFWSPQCRSRFDVEQNGELFVARLTYEEKVLSE